MTDLNVDKLTPPPELVQQIRTDALHRSDGQLDYELRMIHAAYRAGADTELDACCEVLRQKGVPAWSMLRSARRPMPPSLKEQALEAVTAIKEMADDYTQFDRDIDIIRRALEALPND